MKIYNRAHCIGMVRGQFTDKYGRKITIQGIHAFEYTIVIESVNHIVTTERFATGADARKRFQTLKRIR